MAAGELTAVPEPHDSSADPAPERRSEVRAGELAEASELEKSTLSKVALANEELSNRADQHMAVPVAILVEQRDRAIAELERVRHEADRRQAEFTQEQDAFIAFLMVEHEQKVAEVTKQLRATYDRLKRLGALSEAAPSAFGQGSSPPPSSGHDVRGRLDDAETRLILLNEQLREAYREVDEARAETQRIADERDDARKGLDDLRAEIHEHMLTVHYETADLHRQLDDAYRALENARDEARDDMHRLTEQLDAARRELDERREEVRRLRERARAQPGMDMRQSRPPPPPGSYDLETARDENHGLRKQLIDAKREISRVSRELQVVRRPLALPGTPPPSEPGPFRKSTWPGGVAAQKPTAAVELGVVRKRPRNRDR
jgi:chromosome segregation ATPase